jgi:ComF family protein
MSTSRGASTLQALKSSATNIPGWGSDCLLCAAASGTSLVCGACDDALPRLEHACTRCAVPLAARGMCGECLRRAPAFDEALAAFEYRFPLDRLVHRFKYAGDLAVGRWLALRLAECIECSADRPDLLVAPALTAARLRERGFNQAVVLAQHVGKRLGVRHAPSAFRKLRETSPQPGLHRKERLGNLRDAFDCGLALAGEHVAIVDDVMTTGATTQTLAALLKARGAARVSVWCVARTPPARKG